MPRDIKTNLEGSNKFIEKCKKMNLNTILILTETEEYTKYAGGDLEEFYRSIPLEVIHRPIHDFSLPKQLEMIEDMKVIEN
jgi:hypothetical protein